MQAPREGVRAAMTVTALAFATAAAAAAPVYPPFPSSRAISDVAAWIDSQTDVDLSTVVGVGQEAVFALEPVRLAGGRPIAVIRQEVIDETFSRSLGGRSAVMTAEVDCARRAILQKSLDLYAGNSRQGAVRRLGAGKDWQTVPEGTYMDNVIAAVCEADYRPLFPKTEPRTAAAPAPSAPAPLASGSELTERSFEVASARRSVLPRSAAIPYVSTSRPAVVAPSPAAQVPQPAAPAPPPPSPPPEPPPEPPPLAVTVAVAPASPDGPISTQPFTRPQVIAPARPAAPPRTVEAPISVAAADLPPPAPIPIPAPAPVPAPLPPPVAAPASKPPVAAAPKPPAPQPKPQAQPQPAPRKPTPSAASLGLRPLAMGKAQIGSFSTADQAIAAWRELAKAMPGPMSGKGQRVEIATVDGQRRFRAMVDGFASKAEAEAFCRQLAAQKKPCFAAD